MNSYLLRALSRRTALLVGLLISGAGAGVANAAPALQLGAHSTISLDGDSTLHKYSTKAESFDASFELGPATPGARPSASAVGVEARFRAGEVKSVELLVPVAKLKSGEGGLDDNLRKALHADAHRNILFDIRSYEVLAPKAAGAAFSLSMHGQLNVAGVTHDVDVLADGFTSGESVRLSGSKDLLMSDYKVEAPVLMLGMLKTKDLVTIKFELIVQEAPSAAATKVN